MAPVTNDVTRDILAVATQTPRLALLRLSAEIEKEGTGVLASVGKLKEPDSMSLDLPAIQPATSVHARSNATARSTPRACRDGRCQLAICDSHRLNAPIGHLQILGHCAKYEPTLGTS